MSAADTLLVDAADAGLELLIDDGRLIIEGNPDAVQAWAPRLRPHKAELIARLIDSSRITHELLQAAMRCCDHHRDDDTAREQMRADVLGTPPELRAGLLDHFDRAYLPPQK